MTKEQIKKASKLKWRFNEYQEDSLCPEDPFVHIGFTSFAYATLCGLGSEGVPRGNENYLESTNKKVDCVQCLLIYNFCNSVKI